MKVLVRIAFVFAGAALSWSPASAQQQGPVQVTSGVSYEYLDR